jgi:hypothetical protein
MSETSPTATPSFAEGPSKGFAIGSIVLAVLMPLVGFVMALIGYSKAKKAGSDARLFQTAAVLGIAFMAFGITRLF